MFKDSLLKILDEDELIEELCLTKWTDPRVLYVTTLLLQSNSSNITTLTGTFYYKGTQTSNSMCLPNLQTANFAILFVNKKPGITSSKCTVKNDAITLYTYKVDMYVCL